MKPHGTFKIANTSSAFDAYLDPLTRSDMRARRILESIRSEIVEGGAGQSLRIRQIFRSPREIYRLELELPELGYQRTTLLDRDALEELLEADDVRAAVRISEFGH
jgi:hypothetical protein